MEMVRTRWLFFSSAEPGRSETTRATMIVATTRAALDSCTASTPLPVPSIWGSAPEPQYDATRFARIVHCDGLPVGPCSIAHLRALRIIDPPLLPSNYAEADAGQPTSVVGHQRAFLLAMRPSRSSAL